MRPSISVANRHDLDPPIYGTLPNRAAQELLNVDTSILNAQPLLATGAAGSTGAAGAAGAAGAGDAADASTASGSGDNAFEDMSEDKLADLRKAGDAAPSNDAM